MIDAWLSASTRLVRPSKLLRRPELTALDLELVAPVEAFSWDAFNVDTLETTDVDGIPVGHTARNAKNRDSAFRTKPVTGLSGSPDVESRFFQRSLQLHLRWIDHPVQV